MGKGGERPYLPGSSSTAYACLSELVPLTALDFSQAPATSVRLDVSHDRRRGRRFPPWTRPLSYLTNPRSEPRNSTPSEGWRGLASLGAHLLICLCSTFSTAGSPLGLTTLKDFAQPESSSPPRRFTTPAVTGPGNEHPTSSLQLGKSRRDVWGRRRG